MASMLGVLASVLPKQEKSAQPISSINTRMMFGFWVAGESAARALDEVDPARRYRSETQNLLQAIPATTGNLRRIGAAAERDLAWMIENRVASSVTVVVTMPGVNRVKLSIAIEANGEESSFDFVENWKAA